jgi:hypothetical protein
MAQTKTKSPFGGNGLSRTAMLFRIATMAGHRLTVPELNRIRDINQRQLERTYEAVTGGVGMTKGDALFALRLILKEGGIIDAKGSAESMIKFIKKELGV